MATNKPKRKIHENSLKNLVQPSEVKVRAAQSKRGMTYYTQKVKEAYLKDPNLTKSIKFALKRQRILLQKSVSKNSLDKDEVSELSTVTLFLKPFLDKTIASKFESENKHDIEGSVIFYTVKPEIPE